jgi:hypothetical protein
MPETTREPVFWTCKEDAEYLRNYSIADAVLEAWDNGLFDGVAPPSDLAVFGFARREIDKDYVDTLKQRAIESLMEALDEEYGGEEAHDISDRIRQAADSFVDAVLEDYTVWQCECVVTERVNAADYLPHANNSERPREGGL